MGDHQNLHAGPFSGGLKQGLVASLPDLFKNLSAGRTESPTAGFLLRKQPGVFLPELGHGLSGVQRPQSCLRSRGSGWMGTWIVSLRSSAVFKGAAGVAG